MMPTTMTMVYLADSRKIGAHCVAGKIWEGKNKGSWIRPISDRENSALTSKDICYRNGRMPNLLDIISFAVKKPAPVNHQQENWIIDETAHWKKEGELKVNQLADLCDNTRALWVNGYSSTFGENDKVPTEIAYKKITSSLLLIQPEDASYKVGIEYNKKKVRAIFDFQKSNHVITVTDNSAEQYYLAKKVGIYKERSFPTYYCVSLAGDLNGYCYKLIAGIIQ